MHAGEREASLKKVEKAAKKQHAQQKQEAGTASASVVAKTGGITLSTKPAFSIPGVAGKKFKRKGIKIRKNASIR